MPLRPFGEYDPLGVSPKHNPCPQMLGSPKGTDLQTPNLTIQCVEQLQRLWGKTHDMPLLLHSLEFLEIVNSLSEECQKPQLPLLLKKYRNTPPICIAIHLQFVSQYFRCQKHALRKGKYICQYSSHLYRSTPPICIAIRLPFVSQYFWENLGGCGRRDVPHRR